MQVASVDQKCMLLEYSDLAEFWFSHECSAKAGSRQQLKAILEHKFGNNCEQTLNVFTKIGRRAILWTTFSLYAMML